MTEFVYYVVSPTTIDGPDIPEGSEVELRIFGRVEGHDVVTDQKGDRVTQRVLRITDWAGPYVQAHNPPGDAEEDPG